MTKTYRKILLAVLSTLILSYVLFRDIALADISRAFHCFSISSLGIILLWSFLIFFTDTIRYHTLLSVIERKGFTKLFSVITGGNLLLNVLPFRSGELGYIYFMNKELNVSKTEGALVVAVMRIFDMIALLILFFLALFNIEALPNPLHTRYLNGASLGLLAVSLILLFLIIFRYETLKRLIEATFLKLVGGRVKEKMSAALAAGYEYTKKYGNSRTLLLVGILSVLYWFLRYVLGYFVIRTLGMNIGFWEVFLISSLLMFSALIPIQGIGDLGVFEAKWTILFMLFEVSKEAAITSGLTFHILLFSVNILFGVFGLFQMSAYYKKAVQGSKIA